MISADDLFTWAMELGIKVIFRNLCKQHPDLLGTADAADKIITLDQALRNEPQKLKCVLAEEIGHILFPPRPGHVRYHSKKYIDVDCISRSNVKAIVAQDERKALQWATDVLIPDDQFWEAIKGGASTVYLLADWFDVERWFILVKVGFIRRQARDDGQKLRWRDIIKRNSSA